MTTCEEAASAAREDFGRDSGASAKASELVDQILNVSKNLGSVVGREARSAVLRAATPNARRPSPRRPDLSKSTRIPIWFNR